MDNALKTILEKLNSIETRLSTIEGGKKITSTQVQRDPLFTKALDAIADIDEDISSSRLSKTLGIDQKRCEILMDQLAAAGYGTTYMAEV